uniref:Uncharacterized protein n=1 Tax=Astyanax mexicanus TaxID=7994 RepID=A0A3B1IYE8_ASTMX
MLLRIYISDANVRRFLLIEVPTSVDQLKTLLEEKLQLKKGFELQFEDPDFDNALCNLHSIDELPAEKAVLRVVWAIEPSSSVQDISDASSVSSLDTASRSSSFGSIQSPTNLRSVAQWPSPFDVPTFSLDVELRLQKANEIYKETKKPLNVRRDMKSEILNKLAQTIFEIKAYPDACEIESVASALVQKHPCLTEPGAGSGWDGWMMSIKFKLGNYRAKLRDAGCSEVNINRKRERGQVEGLKGRMKKSKRAEVNFLPDHPAGQSDESLEKERVSIVEETRKKRIDATLVRQKMEATFSLRRKEVVEVEPLVEEIRERWPALFYEDEVIPFPMQVCLVLSVPFMYFILLFFYYYLFQDTDAEDNYTKYVKIGIVSLLKDDVAAAASLPDVTNIAIILEEAVVLRDIADLPTAFAYLFGLLYSINMEYPKELKYTFEAMQKIFMDLGGSCSARVQSLKIKLC